MYNQAPLKKRLHKTKLKWAVENDIFPGLSDNYIHAGENAIRGQAAFAFMKLADKFE